MSVSLFSHQRIFLSFFFWGGGLWPYCSFPWKCVFHHKRMISLWRNPHESYRYLAFVERADQTTNAAWSETSDDDRYGKYAEWRRTSHTSPVTWGPVLSYSIIPGRFSWLPAQPHGFFSFNASVKWIHWLTCFKEMHISRWEI